MSAHRKNLYLLRRSKLQRLSDLILPLKELSPTPLHCPLVILNNVRYVPDFKYTLISVKQIWREQSIDARFRDLNHLELPPSAGGITIPYDEKSDLPVVRFISSAQFYNNAGIIGKKTSALTSILPGSRTTQPSS